MMFRLDEENQQGPHPLEIRLPYLPQGFGLGDAVKRLTEALGVHPCTPCEKRQQELNARLQFKPWGG